MQQPRRNVSPHATATSSQSSWRDISAPGFMRRSSSEGRTQANLLRDRRDLEQGRERFEVQLPKSSPIVIPKGRKPVVTRIGMELALGQQGSGLYVADVDRDPRHRTSVAQLNAREERHAKHCEEEQRACFAIKPGDRIRAISAEPHNKQITGLEPNHEGALKKTMSKSGMLAELAAATSFTSPRVVNLSVSRNLCGVMKPSPELAPVGASPQHPPGSTKSNLNALSAAVSPLPPRAPPTPPKTSSASSSIATTPSRPVLGSRSASASAFYPGARRGSDVKPRVRVDIRYGSEFSLRCGSPGPGSARSARSPSLQPSLAKGSETGDRGMPANHVSSCRRFPSAELLRLDAESKD